MLRVIGITFDHTTNYGSCLQAYALGHVITQMRIGNESCTYEMIPICRMPEHKKKQLDKRREGTLKQRTIYTLNDLGFHFHRLRFRGFERRHFRFVKVSRLAELPELNKQADAFICGSDVVWNSGFNCMTKAFYLDFARKYKFSYAASFGWKEIPDKEMAEVGEYLRALDSISCREASGCAMVESYLGKPAELTADPVLLMDRQEWSRIAGKKRAGQGYIFVYVTHITSAMKQFLERIRSQTGLKIVASASGLKNCMEMGIVQVQSPEQWLRLLRDADYVVTNSFHATAFSVLFHKKFFTVVGGEKEGGINIRMSDFLRSMGLESRMLNEVPEQLDLSEIDFSGADRAIEQMRVDSMAYLRRNLEAAYQRKIQAEEAK